MSLRAMLIDILFHDCMLNKFFSFSITDKFKLRLEKLALNIN